MNRDLKDALVAAVSNGRTDIVRSLILAIDKDGDQNPENVAKNVLLNEICTHHGTLLHLAIKLDHVDIARTLLSTGVSPVISNSNGEMPLDLVNSSRMATVFVEELLKATAQSKTDRVQQLLEAGVDIGSHDSPVSRNTPLHWAASFGTVDAVSCLLDHGADVNALNAEGATPLHDAVHRGSEAIVKLLLKYGADPSIRADKGKFATKTPMDLSSEKPVIQDLLYSQNNINSHEKNGQAVMEVGQRRMSLESLSSIGPENIFPAIDSLSLTNSPTKSKLVNCSSKAQEFGSPVSTFCPLTLVTDSRLHQLWPQPQKIIQTDSGNFYPTSELVVHLVQSEDQCLAQQLMTFWDTRQDLLKEMGYSVSLEVHSPDMPITSAGIVCSVSPFLFSKHQSYHLTVTSFQLKLLASDITGLYYAICTVTQLLILYPREEGIPSVSIQDWPSIPRRTILFDMSADARIPMISTLKDVIHVLSCLKVNEVQLYFQFANKQGWQFPYSKKELVHLDDFCRCHCVSFVPVIDVEADVNLELLSDMYWMLKDYISSYTQISMVHIGPHLSRLVANPDQKAFHLSVQNVWRILPIPQRAFVLFHVDSIQSIPYLPLLPRSIVLVEYDLQVSYDFDLPCKTIAQAGCQGYVCSGTSCWNSISGCFEAAILQTYSAVRAAASNNLLGAMVADWAGICPLSSLCFRWPGFLVGAGLCWNCTTHVDYVSNILPDIINKYVVRDSGDVLGQVIVELGRAETYVVRSSQPQNEDTAAILPNLHQSVLKKLLDDPDSMVLDNITLTILQKAVRHVKRCQIELQKAKVAVPHSGELLSELHLAGDLLQFACRLGRHLVSNGRNPDCSLGVAVINVGLANLPPTSRTDMANKLLCLIEQFRAVWLSCNLPLGLHTSLLMFNTLLKKLVCES